MVFITNLPKQWAWEHLCVPSYCDPRESVTRDSETTCKQKLANRDCVTPSWHVLTKTWRLVLHGFQMDVQDIGWDPGNFLFNGSPTCGNPSYILTSTPLPPWQRYDDKRLQTEETMPMNVRLPDQRAPSPPNPLRSGCKHPIDALWTNSSAKNDKSYVLFQKSCLLGLLIETWHFQVEPHKRIWTASLTFSF